MKKKKILSKIMMIVLLILITSFLSYGVMKNKIKNTEYNKIISISKIELEQPSSIEEINYRCKNLNLENTSNCFKSNIATFFNYSSASSRDLEFKIENNKLYAISDLEEIEITNIFNELKEDGGNCVEWSYLYYKLCQETDYDCALIMNEGLFNVFYGHEYAVMYDETNYCKLDQLSISCGENYE